MKNTPIKNNKFNRRYGKSSILKQLVRPFCFLLLFIMICAFLARYLADSETVTENIASNEFSSSEKKQDTSILENTAAPEKDFSYTADESTTVYTEMNINSERTTYQAGFYYEPLNDTVKQRITGISYPAGGCTVPYEELNYVGVLYIGFNGEEQQGELICNKALAQDMVEIFYELYQNRYQIERICLVDEYGGYDIASMKDNNTSCFNISGLVSLFCSGVMKDNNTSCFNYRVVDGTASMSNHAYGLAIDINPFYNPYVAFDRDGTGSTYVSPTGSEMYAERSQDFAYKIDENDLCYCLFIEHGFTWGGSWDSCKDYQHFEKKLD